MLELRSGSKGHMYRLEGVTTVLRQHIVLPTEPNYTEHRDAARRHLETRKWLERRERELSLSPSPPLSPEDSPQTKRPPREAA